MMEHFDLIVIGGGPAGVTAAVAAAEEGKRTLLVENNGCLGGTGTAGGVAHWLGGRSADCSRYVIGGLFRRWTEAAVNEGIALAPQPEQHGYSPFGWDGNPHLTAGIPYDIFAMQEFLDRQCVQAGVEVLFFTRFIGCTVIEERIVSVQLHHKGGLYSFSADFFIDATGDGDLAAAAGCSFWKGRDLDQLMAPATLEFHVCNVDTDALKNYVDKQHAPRMLEEIRRLSELGIWKFPYDRFISVRMLEKGTYMINTSRLVGVDGLDGNSISQAMIAGRRENLELFDVMRKHIPGFAHARIAYMAPSLGVRETRRIKGKYTLTVADVVEGRDFVDTIGYCCYGWDLPDPQRPSRQHMLDNQVKIRGELIPLPFGIMQPQTIDNLLCAGRLVSVERDVLGPVRVMASCMAMGEAAGVAAAGYDDIHGLRAALCRRGCLLEPSSRTDRGRQQST